MENWVDGFPCHKLFAHWIKSLEIKREKSNQLADTFCFKFIVTAENVSENKSIRAAKFFSWNISGHGQSIWVGTRFLSGQKHTFDYTKKNNPKLYHKIQNHAVSHFRSVCVFFRCRENVFIILGISFCAGLLGRSSLLFLRRFHERCASFSNILTLLF